MKIIFVLPDMPGGGSERVVALLSNEYVKRGYEVAILLFAGSQVVYPLDERVEIFIAGEASGGNPLVMLKRVAKMRRYYKENKDSYIFSFCVMGTVFSAIALMGMRRRMLVSERNDPTRIKHQKLRDWAYNKTEKIIFQTEDMKNLFSEKLQKKSVVIPNPVSDGMPEPYEGIRKKKVVSVARLQPQKNHKLLLDAFALFHEKYPDYELHLFGIGELEEALRNQAKCLGIQDKVLFRGFTSNVKEEIWDSAMFVLSSDYEGISNSMIEALAMGVPVISTDCPVGGSKTYIEDQVSGLLTPVGDAQALFEAMDKVASDPAFARNLSLHGAKIKETYKLEKIADLFLQEAGI